MTIIFIFSIKRNYQWCKDSEHIYNISIHWSTCKTKWNKNHKLNTCWKELNSYRLTVGPILTQFTNMLGLNFQLFLSLNPQKSEANSINKYLKTNYKIGEMLKRHWGGIRGRERDGIRNEAADKPSLFLAVSRPPVPDSRPQLCLLSANHDYQKQRKILLSFLRQPEGGLSFIYSLWLFKAKVSIFQHYKGNCRNLLKRIVRRRYESIEIVKLIPLEYYKWSSKFEPIRLFTLNLIKSFGSECSKVLVGDNFSIDAFVQLEFLTYKVNNT